jgi:3'-phosphoadenosine 5'-phosphosulfate sulfotransferase (PAPS reductase)/FAD synthetase
MALPENKIPRVYANTGIELNMIRDFVFKKQENDDRVIIIKPSVKIKPMLEREGYPFKSKIHAHVVNLYQQKSDNKMILGYTGNRPEQWHTRTCPKKLRYQFTDENKLRISDMCCVKMKEEPMQEYAKNMQKSIAIIGTMREEGGRRSRLSCLQMKGSKVTKFQPLAVVTKEWEEWFIKKYDIEICDIYKEPYNFPRTGCKGCPFAINLQQELDTLEKYFPAERKQCEIIWKPVYDEYRRIGYRLKEQYYHQLSFDEIMEE